MSLEIPCTLSTVISGTGTPAKSADQEIGLIELFSAGVCSCGRGFRSATMVENQIMEDIPTVRAVLFDLDDVIVMAWEAHKEIKENRS